MKLSRRAFITSAALAPVACGVPLSYERGTPVAQPKPLPAVRPPQVGQEWSYIKRNVFDGKNLGLVTERIASVGSTIVVERTDENGGKLANEVQGPWGMVMTDPHWSRVINFNPAFRFGRKSYLQAGISKSALNTNWLDIRTPLMDGSCI